MEAGATRAVNTAPQLTESKCAGGEESKFSRQRGGPSIGPEEGASRGPSNATGREVSSIGPPKK
jgi:hypothetical protein